jgi:hypothetical protein
MYLAVFFAIQRTAKDCALTAVIDRAMCGEAQRCGAGPYTLLTLQLSMLSAALQAR